MVNPDFIGIYDNAISSYNCKEIIKWFETNPVKRGSVMFEDGSGTIDTRLKSDWEVEDSYKTLFSNNSFVDIIIRDALIKYTPVYRESYPSVDNIDPWNVCNIYNIQKYDPGDGYHALHCENCNEATLHRVMAWMIYLNTVTDEGGTYFSTYDKTLEAKEGRLVIWPAFFTHTHKGVVSKTQTKYIATGWYSLVSHPDTVK
tara:strand:- start:1145 stop:1747 length:603 start_codon:yes stop_codon:yes gene_type:complete